MSIFKGIGKALGFGGNSEEDESIFTPYDKSQPSSYINPFKKEDNEPKAEPISFVPDTKPEEKAEPAALDRRRPRPLGCGVYGQQRLPG